MDISGYVANLSMAMSQTQLRQSAGIAVAKKAMDMMDVQAEAVSQMLEATPVPSSGHAMDIKV